MILLDIALKNTRSLSNQTYPTFVAYTCTLIVMGVYHFQYKQDPLCKESFAKNPRIYIHSPHFRSSPKCSYSRTHWIFIPSQEASTLRASIYSNLHPHSSEFILPFQIYFYNLYIPGGDYMLDKPICRYSDFCMINKHFI